MPIKPRVSRSLAGFLSSRPSADAGTNRGAPRPKQHLDLDRLKRQWIDAELPAKTDPALPACHIENTQPDRTGTRIALQHLSDAIDHLRLMLAQLHAQPDLAATLALHLLDG